MSITIHEHGFLALTRNASEQRDAAIQLMAHAQSKGGNRMAITNQFVPPSRPDQVLPTNGIMPGSEQSWQPTNCYRLGKLKCFKGPNAERDAWHAGMWLRNFVAHHWNRTDQPAAELCNRLGWSVTNAMGEGSGPSGGYVVPAPLSNQLIEHMERIGVARQIFNITPMTADTLSIPKRAGGLLAYYVGEAFDFQRGGRDRTKDLAKNTKDTVDQLKQLNAKLGQRGNGLVGDINVTQNTIA